MEQKNAIETNPDQSKSDKLKQDKTKPDETKPDETKRHSIVNIYEQMGICQKVASFGEKIADSLKERFAVIDDNAQINQLKVIHAMQKNKVSAACFNQSSG